MNDLLVENTQVIHKKLSKSDAVRQALAQLGVGADSNLLRQKAIEIFGADVDMRTIYQMKSNRKTGRDGIREQKERKIKLRAPKPVSSKNVAPVANKSGKVVNSPVSIQELVKKLEIVKNCIQEVGDKETMLALVQFIA
jgi:hypothetical protein